MYCTNCGAKIEDDARFCEHCGCRMEEVPEMQQQSGSDYGEPSGVYGDYREASQKPKKSKKRAVLIGGVAVAALVAAALIFLFLAKKQTINLNRYMSITFEGTNGYGTASCSFDYEAFEKENSGKIKLNRKNPEVSAYLSMYGGPDSDELVVSLVETSVAYELDKTDELSNGDVVTLSWDCEDLEKYFDCRFKYSEMKHTVEGLEEVETFDPFEGVSVEFFGSAPDGYAEVNVDSGSDVINNLDYTLDRWEGLSNGDVVTLTVSYGDHTSENCAADFGMVPGELTREYTVEGLGDFVKSLSGVTAGVLEEMKTQAVSAFGELVQTQWVAGEEFVDNMTYLGSYFLTAQDEGASDRNICYLVHKVDVTNNDGKVSFYYYTAFYNVMTQSDGTCAVDMSRYKVPTGGKDAWGNVVGEDFSVSPNYYYDGYLVLSDMEAYIKNQNPGYNFESNVKE